VLILIEGADGTGKSTLAGRILDAVGGGTYLHASAPVRHPLVEYTEPLSREPAWERNIVCDRWHLGELVYGPRYRGKSGLTPEQFTAVDQFLDELGAVLVVLWDDIPRLLDRHAERGERVSAIDLAEDSAAFRRLARGRTSRLPTTYARTGEVDVHQIIERARERERGVARQFAA
jgi:thymidylate kinase